MEREKRVFVVNGKERVGYLSEETEGLYWISSYNYMKPDGTFLFPDEDFEFVGIFSNGVASVCKGGKDSWNIIKPDGTYLLPKDVPCMSEKCKDGFFWFYSNEGGNYIGTDGLLLSPDENFGEVFDFNEGLGVVQRQDRLYYYIKSDGTFLNKEGFVAAKYFENGVADITINCKIDKDGNIII